MINSLTKDSHITHYCRLQKTTIHSEKRVFRSVGNSAPENNSNISVNKPAEINFCGFSNTNNPVPWVYRSKGVQSFLKLANINQVAFSAGFALLLTGLLRPAAIMALPGDKKNKDDKIYASAHSIASGVIGFVVATAVSTPISAAIKKIMDRPEDFLKNNAKLIKADRDKIASNYLNKLPDILMAIPKGIITIALIPPILKYVFGWEKKAKPVEKTLQEQQDYSSLNFKSTNVTAMNNFGKGEKQ